MIRRFVEVARDPRIIPGIHHYCDEWCQQCGHTERCLVFRCSSIFRKQCGRGDDEPTFTNTDEAVRFTREIAAAEGLATPELDALVAGGREAERLRTRDPLQHVALEYALGVSMWLILTREDLERLESVRGKPAPEAVVLWFHLRIYMKLVRAIVAKEQTESGRADRHEDALGCAKLTLVAVQRSRAALMQLKAPATEKAVVPLMGLLVTFEAGIDERFPEARRFVRIGLDAPVAGW